ncbi:ribbon-helix-helix domain-containing protein [Azospirillum halopraeferens]|uniref:ribbon-helix-helix domain-containing protein n=1 Tax=Azospirillum halopraeferens TaxID=34010 RepID=UPI00040ED3DC|nr:ribbon-helix-helix domain-containing protein [Azospirillum halopraeferens]
MYEPLIGKNLNVNGRRTSMRLEASLWQTLEEVGRRENISVNHLVSRIERRLKETVGGSFNLTSAVRLYLVEYFRAAATEDGHRAAGHGVGDPFAGVSGSGSGSDDGDAEEGRRRRSPLGRGAASTAL